MDFFANLAPIGVILFVLSLCFLIAELFMPGFGVCGTTGIFLFVACVAVTAKTVYQALMMSALMFLILGVGFILALMLASKRSLPRWIVLKQNISESASPELCKKGEEGIAETALHPAGVVKIGSRRIDAVSSGEFIRAGEAIVVLSSRHGSVVVEKK